MKTNQFKKWVLNEYTTDILKDIKRIGAANSLLGIDKEYAYWCSLYDEYHRDIWMIIGDAAVESNCLDCINYLDNYMRRTVWTWYQFQQNLTLHAVELCAKQLLERDLDEED